jgi:diguanylate cyclase (GGDEF)-like protein
MYSVTQKERLFECSGAVSFTVYADFNCPFCYALNERLFAMNLEHQVDFRMIQRTPDIQRGRITLELLGELTAEVAEVRYRSPSTEINVPMFRPSSAAASTLVYTIGSDDLIEAVQLRRRIYRALWVDGLDISKPDTLASLLLELDIELPPSSLPSNDELTAWQSEWANNSEFNRNIPVIISEQGETLIGFPLEPELGGFLESGSLVSDTVASDLWGTQKRQRILVLDNDVQSLQMIIEQMHDVQIEVVDDFIGLIDHALNLGMPDLVIVNTELIGNISASDWWRNWTNSDLDPAVPIIHILANNTIEAEVAAFEIGAADIITKPFHPKLLRARLNTHLQARRSRLQINSISNIDVLTSIYNRREFDARLLSEWGRGARNGHSLALLMIDVDKFSEFNNNQGHLHGDECLVTVAQLLGSRLLRCGDLMARYSGEVFVALLPGVDVNGALKVARECQQAIAGTKIPHSTSPVAPYVTVSVGVAAMLPIYDKSCTLIIEQAEIALYQAKQEGRNRVCAFDNDTPDNAVPR